MGLGIQGLGSRDRNVEQNGTPNKEPLLLGNRRS